MPQIEECIFDEPALISRLSAGLQKRRREVICIIGSPLTSPATVGAPGVPGVAGIIQMIREEFTSSEQDLVRLEAALDDAPGREYQAAFRYLQGSRGQSVANEIIRRSVLCACKGDEGLPDLKLNDGECRIFESTQENWVLNPGILALGKLVRDYPSVFGSAILTTNFDPLLEIAIRRASGSCYRTVLHAEGSLSQTEGDGCHVIHLHGYWYGSDTLHTNSQLMQDRPRLRSSLAQLLRDKVVLVCGYGGWDDVLTSALLDLARDDTSSIEILWSLHGTAKPSSPVVSQFLAAGLNRGRVSFYKDIDCNALFPRILQAWNASSPAQAATQTGPSNSVHVTPEFARAMEAVGRRPRVLEGDDEDRPPIFDFCFGREKELDNLMQAGASVIFITGIGGQGKSTLAASYFTNSQKERRFNFFVWRDCKDEDERFENQIASVIETLSGGMVAGPDLAKRPLDTLIDMLLSRLLGTSALFVFDNVDHFVNLKNGRLTSAADLFVRRFLEASSKCRIIFTCRPEIWLEENGSLSPPLQGLTLSSSIELFAARKAKSPEDEIRAAHELTDGHAFWLDLLALQVVRNPNVKLSSLLAEIRIGQGHLPDQTLQSIWSKLNDRERTVLHAMAETLRPETEPEIANYLSRDLNYNKVNSAIRALRQLNLVVVKRSSQGEDLHELHPLVRQFVRGRFSRTQQVSMIEAIIRAYNKFRGTHKSELSSRTSFTFLQNWTQAAELAIGAAKYPAACECLAEARAAFEGSAFAREYGRVMRILLGSCDWVRTHSELPHFDLIFSTHAHNLAYLGLENEVDDLLDRFSVTVLETNSRYFLYCELRCHTAWVREDFQEAIRWGRIGHDLYLKSNGVDTDHNVAHTLALALRDAGSAELALPTFLADWSLAHALDPDDLDETRGGTRYGNVGRCLHFMGQARNALICYQKSALLIEKRIGHEQVINQGYIRLWIGELLLSHNQGLLGRIFLDAARRKWEDVVPNRARRLEEMLRQVRPTGGRDTQPQEARDSEAVCLDWIKGRNLDELFEPK
jgi:hypothetical protein